MKTLKITFCLVLFTLFGFSQTKNNTINDTIVTTKVTNLKIEIDVKSLKELESAFKIENLETILNDIKTDETIEFKITCTKAADSTSKMSYKILGNQENKAVFIEMAERIYKSSKKYYIN